MKKNKLIITIITLAVIAVIGVSCFFIGKYYLVNYAFNKYILNSTLDIIKENPDDKKESGNAEEAVQGEQNIEVQQTPEAVKPEENKAVDRKKVDSMTNSQVASIVSRTPSLINRLEGIVSYSDKQHVISILMSNFTQDEIAFYSKKVAGGITSAEKSELISTARSRITSAQWSECMQLFYKYVDELKPYIDETMID